MRIGAGLVLIALGAILRFAITPQHSHGVAWGTVGVILMVLGAVGALITIAFMTTRRRTDVTYRGGAAPVDPRGDVRYTNPGSTPYSSTTIREPGAADPRI
jgi:Na+/melibiose symporter-like transporter